MIINPIKRIKLHYELWKNDKEFWKISEELRAQQALFTKTLAEAPGINGDLVISLGNILNEERRLYSIIEALLKRDKEINKLLYGGLI